MKNNREKHIFTGFLIHLSLSTNTPFDFKNCAIKNKVSQFIESSEIINTFTVWN